MEDLWAEPNEVKSKKFEKYKAFAKNDTVNVKQVILP